MAITTLEGPDGQPVTAKGDADGVQSVAITGGVTVTGGATSANQTTANAKLDTLAAQTDDLEGSATTTATNTTAIASALASSETTWSSLGASVSPTLKSGSGKVWTLFVGNLNTSTTLYAWVYDNTAASGTLLVPIPIVLPPNSFYAVGSDVLTSDGKSFVTGLTVGFSTSRTTYSAHSTIADCHAGGYGS